MQRFETELVAGGKAPYTRWTFIVIPDAVRAAWKRARAEVRGTIGGAPFRGTVAKGEGVYRMPVKRELLGRIGAARGDVVAVAIELDPEPRPVVVPDELAAVLKGDRELARLFDALPPSHRRAWAQHVGEAKQAATRERRAGKARHGIRSRSFPGQGPGSASPC
jgi:hypothetical protein